MTADTTIGAEVVRDLAANTTSFAAGELDTWYLRHCCADLAGAPCGR